MGGSAAGHPAEIVSGLTALSNSLMGTPGGVGEPISSRRECSIDAVPPRAGLLRAHPVRCRRDRLEGTSRYGRGPRQQGRIATVRRPNGIAALCTCLVQCGRYRSPSRAPRVRTSVLSVGPLSRGYRHTARQSMKTSIRYRQTTTTRFAMTPLSGPVHAHVPAGGETRTLPLSIDASTAAQAKIDREGTNPLRGRAQDFAR